MENQKIEYIISFQKEMNSFLKSALASKAELGFFGRKGRQGNFLLRFSVI